jgi:hypothetical protein
VARAPKNHQPPGHRNVSLEYCISGPTDRLLPDL